MESVKKIKKIHINKSDEAASVAEKVIDTDANEIVLSVPKFSRLSESLSNFHLIKREAEILNKKVIVESVDDKVIELCRMSGLECLNPIFVKSRRQVSDIALSKTSNRQTAFSKKIDEAAPKFAKKETTPRITEAIRETREIAEIKPPSKFIRKTVILLILAGVIFAGVKIISILPRSEIKIVTRKTEWNFKDSISVDKAVSEIDLAKMKLPGQFIQQRKNLPPLYFDATGKKTVEKKATGKITVYNGYSSSPQALVLGTRFEAQGGKIFKSVKAIIVPGAQIVEGKIVSSSIEMDVIADKAGVDYNIGPSRFTIPGFKGTPKFLAFYGESGDSMKGGFVGEVSFPTDEDIKKAKEGVAKKLEESVRALVASQLPQDFKIIDGASEFNFLSQTVDKEVASGTSFSASAEAEMSAIAFRENDLSNLLAGKMKSELGTDYEFKDKNFSYGLPRLDIKSRKMTFPVDFKAVATRAIDIEVLKERILGKNESDVKALLFALPGLETAKISFKPFWVKSVPENPKWVKISVE